MDPDKVLRNIRKAIAESNLETLKEDMTNLDEWLSKGGFLPLDWVKKSD